MAGMTNQPHNPALRGAVDLSALKQSSPVGAAPSAGAAPAGQPPMGSGAGMAAPGAGQAAGVNAAPGGSSGFGTDGLLVDATPENLQQLVQLSVTHPVILTVWASSQPTSRQPVDALAHAVRQQDGRVLLAVADLDATPELAQFFSQLSQQAAQQGQPGQVLAAAFVQGQPIPMPPVLENAAAEELLNQIVQIAVQNGLAGRVANYTPGTAQTNGDAAAEPELPATHKLAYEAIERGDYDGAIAAFEQALKENPKDDEARLALGQVKLMKRTQGADLQQARDAAAANPADIEAQMLVADLDLLGGHVEDAFLRLIDVVKATRDDERNTVREHLIELFDVVGAHDPRVKKARTSLMSALY